MKNNIKKLAAVALSSLGVLTSAPSAFCSKESSNKEKASQEKSYAPNKELDYMENGRYIVSEIPRRVFMLQERGDLATNRYSNILISGKIVAPLASGIVKRRAFYEQSRITSLSLPLVQGIEPFAFEGCSNLRTLEVTDSLTHVDPKAFKGCNPNLIINFNDISYTIDEFLRYFNTNSALI